MAAPNPTLQQINDNISVAVQNGKYLTLKTHRMTEMVEKHIQYAVESILDKNERPQLVTTAYTILKELVINGCKANQKRIFFDERGLDITDPQDYVQGIAEYKKIFSEDMALEYGLKARTRGYYVIIDFNFDSTGMTLEVINNTPIARQEETSIRERLKRAMGYNDIAEFYMDQAMEGDSEGAGLGIALIIILLKGENVDPNFFRIIIEEDRTIARLEIPFTEEFVSKRHARQQEG
ncbi:MAG: histidine kinase [Leptospiraceae bacterium]|nr:histidine kinase [Leptospiraceae bacterium]MCB1322593.1 histidine kinase [Leptospiraceae bacterium]